MPRVAHTAVSTEEAADRLAIRELFDEYARCADRRDAAGQQSLFTSDTKFSVYMSGEGSAASYVLTSREALAPVFADLNKYSATTHFNGQSTVAFTDATHKKATGESYTLAHHLYTENDARKIMVASLRYHDVFVKEADGLWYFAERELFLDWAEVRNCPAQ
ncbi:uncharacterized protein EHS24_008522 [Apiotrichum porosum]|uniref:SnoaL-like domain-containing protein n=1 Tax=Apiotrichum porosum TaxID=105984 RepID=A0A427XQL3_9TREE|nr:uncharacterized protein EHS24_008522 [Apiotrichum porosum]RSH81088.1 hypothetical protein EHS24_008522 [Apiotrichum porosum]